MANPNPRVDVTDPGGYRSRILGLVGGRDPLEIMAATPDALAEIVRTHPADALRTRPFEGKWTPNEIIGHMADAECVYGFRLRATLCEDRPTLIGMNQELWVAGQRHNEREPAELAEAFVALRRFNLVLWRRMTPADLARVGLHTERGPESLDVMLRLCAGHDLSHSDQINRYVAAIASCPR
jgi:hypothetical protein